MTDFFNHCWVCGWRARSLLPIVRKFGKHLEQEYVRDFATNLDYLEDATASASLSLPESTPVVLLPKTHRAWSYLTSRDMSERDAWRWRVSWIDAGQDRDRIVFPSFDSDGSLTFWTARAAGDWRPKYVSPDVSRTEVIFNEIDIDFSRPVTLCEGVIDAVKCGDNAVPLLGSAVDESYALFDALVKNRSTVTVFLDGDATRKAFKIAKLLASYDVDVKIATTATDPGSMSKSQCADAIAAAEPYSWELELKSKMRERMI